MADEKELNAKIRAAKEELKSAGPIHRRDLRRHIHRMTVQLAQYNRFIHEAQRGVGTNGPE